MARTNSRRRKASWIGFFVVVLASLSICHAEQYRVSRTGTDSSAVTTPPVNTDSATAEVREHGARAETQKTDNEPEAAKAYKLALQTLSTFPSHPHTSSQGFLDAQPSPFLESLFPNQQGPIATIIRIILKLRQQIWMPEFLRVALGRDTWVAGRGRDELSSKAVKTVDLLEHAIELGHVEAMYKLAQISLFPPNPLLENATRALGMYHQHAKLTGNSTSQTMLAFFYATGYKDIVQIDQAKALLYYTFAAHSEDKGAQMALGYRYWAGIGVNDDCMEALDWYQSAAKQSMSKFLSGPPGGRTLLQTTTRLSDLDGGVFGPGASVASTGLNAHRAVIKAASARQAGETWEDVLEYYMFNADRGEMDFAYRLGKIFYIGSIYQAPGGIASGGEGVSAIPRDFVRARQYFLRIAWQVWPRDSHTITANPKKELQEDGTLSYAVASAGYLGRMYLRGEGVKQDFALAKMWYERGAAYGEKECHNGLGIIWRDGLVGGKRDVKKANLHFGVASGQELAEAQVNLGKYHYSKGELKLAITHFESAIRQGSPFEPYFYLAQIHAGLARSSTTSPHLIQSSCTMAVSFYKLVAERGSWSDDLVREGEAKWRIGTDKAKEAAMLRWWIAAERGIECAQNNLAYILDQDRSVLRFTRFAPPPSNDTARLALTQWSRSAAQRNVDALVKVGDYYYHGLGVPDEPESVRWEKAAAYYQSAVDTQVSAMAMWNLGWMYENGIGVAQDFHLAKRHYDMALETNAEAYLPVVLSLIKLHFRSLWHTLMGGKNGLTLWPEEAPPPRKDPHTLDGTDELGVSSDAGREDEYMDDQDDGQWYMGRARDELNKRRRKAEAKRHRGEEDPIEWARNRRNAENDRDSDFGPEDYFEGALRGGRRQAPTGDGIEADEEDEFAETMLLVFLCLVVSLLIWLRGRWVERRRREEEERRGAGGDERRNEAVFPPGDPPRDDWAVLR